MREIPIEVLQARPNMIRPIQAIRLQSIPERENQPNYPQREVASLRDTFGLTNEDLMNIQRLAQERIESELRSLAQEDLSSDSNSSENDDDDNSDEMVMNIGPSSNSQQQNDQSKNEDPKRKWHSKHLHIHNKNSLHPLWWYSRMITLGNQYVNAI